MDRTQLSTPDKTCYNLREDTGCAHTGGVGNSSKCANHPSCPELHLAEDLEKVTVLCAMNETHQRFGPVEMEYKAGILADRDLLFICPDCENRVRIVFKSQEKDYQKTEAKQAKPTDISERPEIAEPKEPEIVQCSCGETFDWEHWDRKTWPVPKGIHEAVRHLDMGHTLGNTKKAEG